jgi:hypothetical protein
MGRLLLLSLQPLRPIDVDFLCAKPLHGEDHIALRLSYPPPDMSSPFRPSLEVDAKDDTLSHSRRTDISRWARNGPAVLVAPVPNTVADQPRHFPKTYRGALVDLVPRTDLMVATTWGLLI